MKKETIIRTALLLVALLNQVLTMAGKNPLPFSDEAVYEGITAALTVVASLWAWWKNNSFTAHACEADRFLDALRGIDR